MGTITGMDDKIKSNTNTVGGNASTAGAIPKQQTKGFGKIMGFGSGGIAMMNSNQGSEYTNGIAMAMHEAYLKLPTGDKPKVNVLDKEVVSGLAYSAIIVSNISPNGTVYYFTIVLEQTGRDPMKAQDIASEVINASRVQGQRLNVHTTDDAIDSILHKEAIRVLSSEWGSKEFLSVDGVVIGRHHDTNISLRLASIAYNAITVDITLAGNDYKDLNIAAALDAVPNSTMKLECTVGNRTELTEIDKPIRVGFKVDLNLTNNDNTNLSINTQDARDTLCSVSGFVDTIPMEVPAPVVYGQPVQSNMRLHPNIIITSNSINKPTPGHMLLGVIAGMVMSNQNMWLSTLMPTNPKDPHNAGALNIMTNLENSPDKIGGSLASDLTGKKLSPDAAYDILRQMYMLDPIVSYDIETFGPQTFYTSMLAIASAPGNSEAKQSAAKEIVDTAVWLTNGHFPSNFNINDIFVNTGVMVPLGTWADKSGERDIRDIDLAFIANMSGDVSLLNRWVLSGMGMEASGVDSFIARSEIIAQLIPDAEINGKAVRVTFTSNFLTTLVGAAQASGLNANYEPQMMFNEQHSLGMVGDIMNGAGIQAGQGNFGRQHIHSGPQFSMNGAFQNLGYNRY